MNALASVTNLIAESQSLEGQGDIPAALRKAQQALAEARLLGNPELSAQALLCLSKTRFRLGHLPAAQALAQEALDLSPSNTTTRADALLRLASCAAEMDALPTAEALYHQAADLGCELGYHHVRMVALHCLAAGVYIPRGQFGLAMAADEEALQIGRAQHYPEARYAFLITIAMNGLVTGQLERARGAIHELEQTGLQGSYARGYYDFLLGWLAQAENDYPTAFQHYARAWSIAKATGEPGLNIEVLLGMSRARREAGDFSAAHSWAEEALAFARKVGYVRWQANALIERGRAAWCRGEPQAAVADLEAASEILEAHAAAFDAARARLLLAALLHGQKKGATGAQEAAVAWLKAARAIQAGGYAFLLEAERSLTFPLVAAHLNDPDAEAAARTLAGVLIAELERVPPPPLHIFTLGRFEVWQGRKALPEAALRFRQAGSLLRLLLVSPGRSLGREQAIEALWPEKAHAAAITAFHLATSALRRALEPGLPNKFPSRYVSVQEGRVALYLPPGSAVDFETFEELIQKKDYVAALELWQGEPFPLDRYQDWASWKREQLAGACIRALSTVASQKMAAGLPEEALAACQRILEMDPWQEGAVLVGMKACLALNDRTGAVRLYQRLESCLKNELGILPQEELRQLYQTLG